jgi:selenocysteine lyase/cysteine desulfurase
VVKVKEEKAGIGPLVEEAAALAKEAVDAAQRALEVAARWRRKYSRLRRRAERALERLRDAVAELEEAERFGDDRVHVRNALEILYDVASDLEVGEE